MQAFAYASPSSLEQATKLLGEPGALALAGGTDLLSLMKSSIERPSLLVNLKQLSELQGIDAFGDALRIGAAATLDELAEHPDVKRRLPALVQAIDGILSPQIRSMGTVGGELCQRPRCWYYRSGFGLLARHEGRSMVEDGNNRYHSIFGDGPARFVHPSSLAPALIALRARVRLVGPQRDREIALAEFFRSPSSEGERETVLEAQEILTEVVVPDLSSAFESRPTGHNATYEVRNRQALDWPIVGAAAALDMDGDVVRRAYVVLGHVAPTPWVSQAAASSLEGVVLTDEVAAKAGSVAIADARPLSNNGYKVQLAKVAVKRAVLLAARGAAGGTGVDRLGAKR